MVSIAFAMACMKSFKNNSMGPIPSMAIASQLSIALSIAATPILLSARGLKKGESALKPRCCNFGANYLVLAAFSSG